MVRVSSVVVLLVGFVVVTVRGQAGKQFQGTFSGESGTCDGIYTKMNISDSTAEFDRIGIVQSVANSFMLAKTGVDNAQAEALSIGKLVVQAVTQAIADIDAEINSPNPGCWAIAYGETDAASVTSTVTEAIFEGISLATNQDVAATALEYAQLRGQNITDTVASVVLLLASGDGSGIRTAQTSTTDEMKAIQIGCVLAYAYAEVFNETETEATEIVEGVCPTVSVSPLATIDTGSGSHSCACLKRKGTVPAGCGSWGGHDNICYVQAPHLCSCAQSSLVYSGQKWRYCGPTLEKMMSWLSIEDGKNDIQQHQGSYGYCPSQNPDYDTLIQETLQPNNHSQPEYHCPRLNCSVIAPSCCRTLTTDQCRGRAGRIYHYRGRCQDGKVIWAPDTGINCYC
eukprot:TRINITY_DN16202_c1_g1_i4.p1 TRINITY_DN16202_c1_g1~~TRINITY_DN16202_c1_g1_i4.p1  ORF type:complete len:398 (-),score=29.91 TRINITY_DN16202_c1_g1_i4:466-1659(-)